MYLQLFIFVKHLIPYLKHYLCAVGFLVKVLENLVVDQTKEVSSERTGSNKGNGSNKKFKINAIGGQYPTRDSW